MSDLFDVLSQKGPTDEVYGVRDSSDGVWIGTADRPSLYRDKIVGDRLLAAQSRARASAAVMQVQMSRPFEFALYDGGAWKDTILSNDGTGGVRFT